MTVRRVRPAFLMMMMVAVMFGGTRGRSVAIYRARAKQQQQS
jgi:hypothetical protein